MLQKGRDSHALLQPDNRSMLCLDPRKSRVPRQKASGLPPVSTPRRLRASGRDDLSYKGYAPARAVRALRWREI